MPTNLALATHFFIQLAVILACCRAVGLVLRRLGQTQVVSDMVAGFLLGPSLLGLAFPDAMTWLFPTKITVSSPDGGTVTHAHPSLQILYVVGQVALVFYMFIVGVTFDKNILKRHRGQALYTSLAGVITPVILGGIVGWMLVPSGRFFTAGIESWQAAIFVGSAIAITAFPMLARIIYEQKLTRTRIGTIAITAAAFDDAVAWILLALVVSTASKDPMTVSLALGGAVFYLVFMIKVGRPALARLEPWAAREKEGPSHVLVVTSLIVLACAAFTEAIGVYSVFGAFICGTVMPRGEFTEKVRGWLEKMTASVLLPVFFIYSGLNTSLKLLMDPFVLGVMLVVVVVAVAAKGGAVYVVCRANGADRRESSSVAALMNARGLMELILLNIGLERGLITSELYTILALMTVITTLAASPLYFWAQRRWADQDAAFSEKYEDEEPAKIPV